MVALEVLAITFLVLLFVGLSIYSAFFILNKVYLKKLTNLMNRYNKLTSIVEGINFYKIEVLIKSELPIKIDLNTLKEQYKLVSENITRLYSNISLASEQVDTMNLKQAKIQLAKIEKELDKNEKYVSSIKKQYDNYTSYGDSIDEVIQMYLEIYENLKTFYHSKILFNKHFDSINELFDNISKLITQIRASKLKFEFKKTVNSILDLKKKLIVLINAIEIVLQFQLVINYLRSTNKINDQQINNTYSTIHTQDLQWVEKLKIEFKQYFNKFLKAYSVLNLTEARKNALIAADIMQQITSFVYVHTKTQDLIDVSIAELNKQTKTILANKNKIIDSIHAIAKYFIKNPKVSISLKEVVDDINVIEKDISLSKVISSKTYTQKLTAIRHIQTLSKEIYDKKEHIKNSINQVNDTLSNVIQIIYDLNNLYIYFWQILVMLRKTNKTSTSQDIEVLIKNNLNLIDEYAKEIVTQPQPNYLTISKNLSNMEQNINQLTSRIENNLKLKTYASNLVIYANRYKNSTNVETYSQINLLYKQKDYAKCIDLLLSTIKKAKRNKKHETK